MKIFYKILFFLASFFSFFCFLLPAKAEIKTDDVLNTSSGVFRLADIDIVKTAEIVKCKDCEPEMAIYYIGGRSDPETINYQGKEITEDISKREPDKVFFNIGDKHIIKVYFDDQYIQDDQNNWRFLQVGTTTADVLIENNKSIENIEPLSFLVKSVMATTTNVSFSADTYIDKANATSNYGSSIYLDTYYASGNNYTLLFLKTLPSYIGTIDTLELYLYKLTRYGSGSGKKMNLYEGRRTNWIQSEANWNIFKTGSNWGTAGCLNTSTDYVDTVIDAITPDTASANWDHWVVAGAGGSGTPLTPSFGQDLSLIIRGSADDANINSRYVSSEYTDDTSKRPYLKIVWSSAPPVETGSSTIPMGYLDEATNQTFLFISFLFFYFLLSFLIFGLINVFIKAISPSKNE